MNYHLPRPTYVIKTNHDYYLHDFDFKAQLPLLVPSIDAAYRFQEYQTASHWMALMIVDCEVEEIEPVRNFGSCKSYRVLKPGLRLDPI